MLDMLKECRKFFGPWLTAASPRLKPSRTVLWLEALERRDCPSGPPPGGGTTGAVWQPQNGSTDGTLATNYVNGVLPNATTPLILDGSTPARNKSITFGANLPTDIASIQVVNGYQNTLSFSGGVLNTLNENDITSNCTLTIAATNNDGGVILKNNNAFVVQSGGTLKLTDNGAAGGGTFFTEVDSGHGFVGDYLNNAGTVSWTGTTVASGKAAIVDQIQVPIKNTSTFKVDGGTNGNTTLVGGILLVSGQDATNTNNVSFYNNGGTLAFSNDGELDADNNFYQSGGSITSDSTGAGQSGGQACALYTGLLDGSGDININGGKVVVDNDTSSVGTLKFAAKTVEIGIASVYVNVETSQNGKSNLCDLLDCGGATLTLNSGASYLNIGQIGSYPLGSGDDWIVMKYGSLVNKWYHIDYPDGTTPLVQPTQVEVKDAG